MSLTGFHPLWDKILSQNLQAVADQGCHLKGSSPHKGIAYRGVMQYINSLPNSSEWPYVVRSSHFSISCSRCAPECNVHSVCGFIRGLRMLMTHILVEIELTKDDGDQFWYYINTSRLLPTKAAVWTIVTRAIQRGGKVVMTPSSLPC
jgi:hypothetical protein